MLMRDMDKAVARIQKALANDETIAVFGDYDVDGITSTVLLLDYLKNCGAKCLRCWKVLPTVGSDAAHADLCPRCAAVMAELDLGNL